MSGPAAQPHHVLHSESTPVPIPPHLQAAAALPAGGATASSEGTVSRQNAPPHAPVPPAPTRTIFRAQMSADSHTPASLSPRAQIQNVVPSVPQNAPSVNVNLPQNAVPSAAAPQITMMTAAHSSTSSIPPPLPPSLSPAALPLPTQSNTPAGSATVSAVTAAVAALAGSNRRSNSDVFTPNSGVSTPNSGVSAPNSGVSTHSDPETHSHPNDPHHSHTVSNVTDPHTVPNVTDPHAVTTVNPPSTTTGAQVPAPMNRYPSFIFFRRTDTNDNARETCWTQLKHYLRSFFVPFIVVLGYIAYAVFCPCVSLYYCHRDAVQRKENYLDSDDELSVSVHVGRARGSRAVVSTTSRARTSGAAATARAVATSPDIV